MAIESYLRKEEKAQISDLKQLEKEEETKPKISRRKEIIKIRAEINEIETEKTIEKIKETKSWLFEKQHFFLLLSLCLFRVASCGIWRFPG